MTLKHALIAATATACLVHPASAQGVNLGQFSWFTGDTRLSCEAIMCLSSSKGSSEFACQPSLRRYFGIVKRKLRDTIRARHDFLNLCPASSQTPAMQTLVAALASGAGRCDAAALNMTVVYLTDPYSGEAGTYISNVMPDYCTALYTHPNTAYPADGLLPRYVGLPERGGLWADPQDYDRVLAEYTARVAAEDAERAASGLWWR
jgi:hypothetical protein